MDIHCTDGENEAPRGTLSGSRICKTAVLGQSERLSMGGEGQPLQDGYGQRAVSEEGLWKQRKPVVFGRWVWRGVEDEKCGGAEAMDVDPEPIPPNSHSRHDLQRTGPETQDLFLQRVRRLDLHEDLGGARGGRNTRRTPGPRWRGSGGRHQLLRPHEASAAVGVAGGRAEGG